MGDYRYFNHPSRVATAILLVDGREVEAEVALFRFGYKPYLWGGDAEKLNQRMHLTSGAAKAAAAWTRERKAGRKMPKYGVSYDREAMQVRSPNDCDVFLTCGHATHLDGARRYDGAKVVRWVSLPAGIGEAEPTPPEMHERITPAMVLQVKRGGERGAQWPAFRARLADKATGETMPGWWLFSNTEQLEAHALKLGVLAEAAPADAA